MSRVRSAPSTGAVALLSVAGLAALAVPAWIAVVRSASSMTMPGAGPSLPEAAVYTLEWGVMMTAMMLPSATPMLLLYRTVGARLSAEGDRVAPMALFTAVYLLLWLATGVPVYLANVAVAAAASRWPAVAAAAPYLAALVLAAAGAYQFTSAKRACLRHCESPLSFLMRRWRSGYAATLRLAALHAAYCIGCCWGLMVILVAVGAMSLPWVLAITAIVFAEKVLPGGGRTARLVGAALVALAAAITVHPPLASAIRAVPGSHAMPPMVGHGPM